MLESILKQLSESGTPSPNSAFAQEFELRTREWKEGYRAAVADQQKILARLSELVAFQSRCF